MDQVLKAHKFNHNAGKSGSISHDYQIYRDDQVY